MKLMSLKSEGQNRAAILYGQEVIDVTSFLQIVETTNNGKTIFRDALDLHNAGAEWLGDIVSRLEESESLAKECRKAGALKPLSEVSLNPPVVAPGKILGVGLNYAAHLAEQNAEPPLLPLIFSKCTTALIGHGEQVRLPRISDHVDYEAELAIIIGAAARSIDAERAFDYVAGYTIMNDVTARDLQKRERQWARAKGLDTFAPCGPWLVTKDEIADPHSLSIELRLNDELRQSSNTSDLIFKIPRLIEFISQDLTLMPGDIISTGTPSGVGAYLEPPSFLKAGDRIEIKIERIGVLQNSVAGQPG
jgi:2-keto-4-pentenoate hydratase/2-oxohepta-3-ene-1,7-dioic acid hydratase in catechol pathway